jgi:hypothetical protein
MLTSNNSRSEKLTETGFHNWFSQSKNIYSNIFSDWLEFGKQKQYTNRKAVPSNGVALHKVG